MATKKIEGEVHETRVLELHKNQIASIILASIRRYRFNNNGVSPDEVMVPRVNEVDGIPIVYEEAKDEVANDKE